MRSTRTGLAAALVTLTAALALTMGVAGQAAASEQTTGAAQPAGAPQGGMLDEVPWTGPVPGLLGLLGDIVDEVTDGEVPWT